jgi:hypothetical protein
MRYSQADRAIMDLAERQHGVVSRAQVLAAGVPAGVLSRRVLTPMMRLLHRGVYLVGPTLVPHGRAMAAVLACGTHAWVSHDSAGALWRAQTIAVGGPVRRAIVLSRDGSETVDVTITRGDHRRSGIRVHRTGSLPADEVTTLERIPITTPERTLLDLAASLPIPRSGANARGVFGESTHDARPDPDVDGAPPAPRGLREVAGSAR